MEIYSTVARHPHGQTIGDATDRRPQAARNQANKRSPIDASPHSFNSSIFFVAIYFRSTVPRIGGR